MKSERIMQILLISPTVPTNYVKFTKSTPMASELQESTANHADVMHFTHSSCQLHEIHAIHTDGQ